MNAWTEVLQRVKRLAKDGNESEVKGCYRSLIIDLMFLTYSQLSGVPMLPGGTKSIQVAAKEVERELSMVQRNLFYNLDCFTEAVCVEDFAAVADQELDLYNNAMRATLLPEKLSSPDWYIELAQSLVSAGYQDYAAAYYTRALHLCLANVLCRLEGDSREDKIFGLDNNQLLNYVNSFGASDTIWPEIAALWANGNCSFEDLKRAAETAMLNQTFPRAGASGLKKMFLG